MVKRSSLAIKFFISYEQGTGAANYFINIVKALNHLPDPKKPSLVILYNSGSPIQDMKAVNYPYIQYFNIDNYKDRYLRLPLVARAINKLTRIISKRNFFKAIKDKVPVDTIFDIFHSRDDSPEFPVTYAKKVCWLVDFQHRHLPDYFTNENYQWFEDIINDVIKSGAKVLLSSADAKNDFDKFYYYHRCETAILRFPSLLPEQLADHKCSSEYLGQKYFMVCNQFWPHKNYLTVIKAVAELKKSGKEILVLITGHSSNRAPGYCDAMQHEVKDKNLEKNIIFLGFIQRLDQLKLIQQSISVIQPSFFEGWSTIVEDCKSLNKHIILSDLKVHYEQINDKCQFFNRHDYIELAHIMEETWNKIPESQPKNSNVENVVLAFADTILDVFELKSNNPNFNSN